MGIVIEKCIGQSMVIDLVSVQQDGFLAATAGENGDNLLLYMGLLSWVCKICYLLQFYICLTDAERGWST